MANVKVLNIKILADIREFSSAMANVSRQAKAIGKEMEDIGKSLTLGVTLPLAGIGVASLKAFADIDQLKRGLIAVTGSTEAANAEFERLKEVAKLPGLGLEEAVQGSINLQAIGVSAEEARRVMLSFGNAIATVGGGKMNFDLAIRGFTQLRNAAKPMQQDLYQIANQLPQINKLMIEAFGTNRAEDLAAMGISGKELADFLVQSLEKLPSVTGGIGNSFENFGDTMKVTFAAIGESLNKAFDIEGLINRFSAFVAGLVEKFNSLSPSMQKLIFSIAGIAAAMGPVLFIMGSLGTTVIPMIIRGFGLLRAVFLTNPFGIIATAVAVAIGLIISNWDAIVEYFTNGEGAGVFEKLSVIISAAMDLIGNIIGGVIDSIMKIWGMFGDEIMNFTSGVFNFIVGIVDSQLGFIVDIFQSMITNVLGIYKFFKGLFSGDWALMWEGMKDIVASFVNVIIDGIRFMVKNVLGPIKTLADAVGLDGVSGAMDEALTSVDSFFQGIKLETAGTKQAKDILDSYKESIEGVNAAAEKPIQPTVAKPMAQISLSPEDNGDAEKERKRKLQEAELESLRAFNLEKQAIEMAFAQGDIATQEDANLAKADALIKYKEREVDIAKQFHEKEKEAQYEFEDSMYERALLVAEQEKAIEQAKRQEKINTRNAVIGAGQQVIGALRSLAGQSKGLALFEIGVNTAVGVAKAVAAGAGIPFPGNLPAIGSGVAAVLSGIASAKGLLSKAPAFALGGAVMGGPTMSLLGDNPSGKEAIVPFERMTEFASRLVGNVGSGAVQVFGEVKIQGRDMLLLIRNAERAEGRFA